MKQKGQITKHEWLQKSAQGAFCPYCETTRVETAFMEGGVSVYVYSNTYSKPVFEEPPCISRKIQTDENRC